MKRLKIIFMCVLATFSISLSAQKQQFKKADKYYKSKNYSQAIPLYKEGLAIKANLAKQTKLANCYRMINQIEEAEKLYEEIVKKPKAKTNTYYYYAETLMSNQKYDRAKYWFEQYHKFHPEKGKGRIMADACEKIKDIQAYFAHAEVLEFSQNSDADDSAPVFFNGGIVFSSDRKMGVKLLKQKSGTTGRDFITLYFSKEQEDAQFKKPKKFSGKLNELNKNTANISFTADSTRAVFSKNSNVTNRKNAFTLQLYQAESSNGGKKWKNVKEIEFCNLAYNYMHPTISPDGRQLFFVSDKPGGQGGTDLYVAMLKKDGKWGRPVNLGTSINTSSNEGFPYFHHDGKLYFCSKGHVGFGGFDIFFSQRQPGSEDWITPVNVGQPINSSADDISIYIDRNDTRGLFTSSRKGNGDDDIYLFWLNGIPDSLKNLQANEANLIAEEVVEDKLPTEVEAVEAVEAVEEIIETKPDNPSTPMEKVVESPSVVPTTESEIADPIIEKKPPIKVIEQPAVESTIEKTPVNIPKESANTVEEEEEEVFVVNRVTKEDIEEEKRKENTSDVEKELKALYGLMQPTEASTNVSPPVPTRSQTSPVEEVTSPSSSVVEEKVEQVLEASKPMDVEPIEKVEESIPDQVKPIETPEVEQPQNTSSMIVSTETLIVSDSEVPEVETASSPSGPSAEDLAEIKALAGLTREERIATLTRAAVPFKQMKRDLKKRTLNNRRSYRMDDMSFEMGSYLVNPTMEKELEVLYNLMESNANIKIEISSHTFSVGSEESNEVLSHNRATAVCYHLIRKGIPSERIKVVGHGEKYIINHCTEGYACTQEEHNENERIELRLLDF